MNPPRKCPEIASVVAKRLAAFQMSCVPSRSVGAAVGEARPLGILHPWSGCKQHVFKCYFNKCDGLEASRTCVPAVNLIPGVFSIEVSYKLFNITQPVCCLLACTREASVLLSSMSQVVEVKAPFCKSYKLFSGSFLRLINNAGRRSCDQV